MKKYRKVQPSLNRIYERLTWLYPYGHTVAGHEIGEIRGQKIVDEGYALENSTQAIIVDEYEEV